MGHVQCRMPRSAVQLHAGTQDAPPSKEEAELQRELGEEPVGMRTRSRAEARAAQQALASDPDVYVPERIVDEKWDAAMKVCHAPVPPRH